MRYAFGLGGLLVTVGVIIWIMAAPGGELDHAKSAIDVRNKVQPELNRIGGKGEDGTPAEKSATFEGQNDPQSGKFRGLLVADVLPAGAFEKHFGLKQYDLIIQAGPIDLRTQDEGMAKALVVESFQRGQELTVIRGNDKLTLPQASTAATPTTPGQPAAQPNKPKSTGLSGQLESIQNSIPTH